MSLKVNRNPKDAAVSAFHHNRAIIAHGYEGPWWHFLRMYEQGHLEHGSWFEHVRDWWTEYKKYPSQVGKI